MPRSADFGINRIGNSLMYASMGISGTVTWGDTDNMPEGPCYTEAQTLQVPGRFAFGVGPVGSVQKSSDNFADDGMTYTVGAPTAPAGTWSYATTTKDGVQTFYGANGFIEAFVGFSNRYMVGTTINDGVRVKLQIEVVGDAARMRWTMTNQGTDPAALGLMFGATPGMLTNGATSNTQSGSANASGYFLSGGGNSGRNVKDGYVYMPTTRPPRTDAIFDRTLSPTDFPAYVDFVFGQTDYFGFRIENTPSDATLDTNPANVPTEADHITVGKHLFLLGIETTQTPTFNMDNIQPDTYFLDRTSFVQRFPEQVVLPGQSRQILHYVRSTWSVASYALPYGVVVDAPKLIATRTTDFNGNPSDGGIVPNPFQVRVYVDNVGGYAFDGREFQLNNVRINLKFDAGSDVTIQNGSEKVMAVVNPQQIRFVDFTAKAGPNANGNVGYTVTIESQPGNVTKTLTGKINIAARPRLTLNPDVNFITSPYSYIDSSWEEIFKNFSDPLIPGGKVQAFVFDPQQQGYVVSLGAERGRGMWVLYTSDANTPVTADLAGTPSTPANFLQQSQQLQLKSGWNQIGNPYNYSFPISQMLGVTASNPGTSYKWSDLVSLGVVSNFLSTYNPTTGDYEYVDGSSGLMDPNRGYWIFVQTADDLSLSYPPLFAGWVPDQARSKGGVNGGTAPKAWTQTANKWRLKLSARTETQIDAENYIGVAANAKDAKALQVYEPPIAPTKTLGLSVSQMIDGKATRLSQAMESKGGRKEWTVQVDVRKAGQVTLTWPNLSTVPQNMRFHITDVANGNTRDLRRTSGYTFTADKVGTRVFKVTAEEGTAARAVIGNIVVTQPGRATDKNAPFTINYTLSSDSSTSVRILAGNGREIYIATRGRADRAGENTVTWTLRDKANRAVAPGTYRVEIIAETATGERVRKVVPLNVTR